MSYTVSFAMSNFWKSYLGAESVGELDVPSRYRPDRNKPDQAPRSSSQGPLSSIRAAIKRSSSRAAAQIELQRERRRPEITILSAEPIGPSPWYPGVPGDCIPSPRQGHCRQSAAHSRSLWRIDEPVAAEPPPSYEQVIREINQQQVIVTTANAAPRRTTTSASTQTDFVQEVETPETSIGEANLVNISNTTPSTVPVPRPLKPPRPLFLTPIPSVEIEESLISIESSSSTEESSSRREGSSSCKEQSVQTNTDVVERPIPKPRSLVNLKVLWKEAPSETSDGEDKESLPDSDSIPLFELCQGPATEDNFDNQDTMGDGGGHNIHSRIKAFETQTDSENTPGCAPRPLKRPEAAPRSFGLKPAVTHAKPTLALKPSVVNRNLGDSATGTESKPIAVGRQGPVLLPKPQSASTAAVLRPEPPKKSKVSLFADVKASGGVTNDSFHLSNEADRTPKDRPEDRKLHVPVPAPRPTVAKRITSFQKHPAIAPKPFALAPRPSVVPVAKTFKVQDEGSSTNQQAPSLQDVSSSGQDLISFDDDLPVAPTGDNVTSLVTVDPFQTLVRGATLRIDTTPGQPPPVRKPTVIRIPNKSVSSEDTLSPPPPLPLVTPVGNLSARKPSVLNKTAVTELSDGPGPPDTKPWPPAGKVPPARRPTAKVGPARPPPPKIAAAPNSLRRSASELAIFNTDARKTSPSRPGRKQSKSQVLQKNRPDLPPRPSPGHPLYNQYMLPVPHGIAECEVNSKVSGDLSFQRGDVLVLQRRVDGKTLRCQKGLETGKVLQSHMTIITPLDDEQVKVSGKKPSPQRQPDGDRNAPHATVLHDFIAEQNDELNLKAGDAVYLLEKLDKDWFSGKCKGHTGIFPASFVKVVVDLPASGLQERNTKKVVNKSSSLTRGPRCVARFDFEGEQPDELTFFEGDVIALKEYLNEEWVRGQLKGHVGTFPLNFVEIIEDLPMPVLQPSQNTSVSSGFGMSVSGKTEDTPVTSQIEDLGTEWCEALYDFKAEDPDDLSFKQGDRILIMEQLDAEWYKGKLNGHEGIFPTAFVQFCSGTVNSVKQTLGNKRGKAKALYDFAGENEDELTFKVGDMIVELESIDADWMKGELLGKEGIFPRNFVQIVQEPL
uniref:SH3 domain-containing protein n=2 Tax=Callorhinchus milii TaxID=7868 RepID=A0A4W3I5G3_CALMI